MLLNFLLSVVWGLDSIGGFGFTYWLAWYLNIFFYGMYGMIYGWGVDK
jgi:hypothetical protein